jgi:hypothetical protein
MFWYKKIFPVFWFGFLALMFVTMFCSQQQASKIPLIALFIPLIMMVFGYGLMRALVFDLVDEVWDDGNSLIVKNKGVEERIPFSNIININYQSMRPPRATLTLRQPSRFGTKIVFSPQTSLAFSLSEFPAHVFENKIVNDLIQRINH